MDNIIDLGKITVPKSWDEISLKKYQEIEKYYSDKDKNFNIMDVLDIMIDKTRDFISSLPSEFLEKILEYLSFMAETPNTDKPTNKIEISGETYTIHFENQLKVGEYIAADTIMKSDSHNYAALLAILCRKDGELYDSKFENEIIEDRIKMFENLPITKVLGLVQFFFLLLNLSTAPTLLYSNIEEAISLTRKQLETSQKNGTISRLSMRSAMKKLKKLEKSISTI